MVNGSCGVMRSFPSYLPFTYLLLHLLLRALSCFYVLRLHPTADVGRSATRLWTTVESELNSLLGSADVFGTARVEVFCDSLNYTRLLDFAASLFTYF